MISHSGWRLLERGLLLVGLLGVGTYGASRLHAHVAQARAASMLAAAMPATNTLNSTGAATTPRGNGAMPSSPTTPTCPSARAPAVTQPSPKPGDEPAWRSKMASIPKPNMSMWAQGRRECHARACAALKPGDGIARLDIPRIDLSVVVLAGTDDTCLDGGVGYIPGTALPGEAGNVGIAGHRDGFFRGLEQVALGDVIRLTSPQGVFEYRIEWTRIVDPKDVSVLADDGSDVVTLVTCYPFRYIGHAPKRYIVRARCAGAPQALKP